MLRDRLRGERLEEHIYFDEVVGQLFPAGLWQRVEIDVHPSCRPSLSRSTHWDQTVK